MTAYEELRATLVGRRKELKVGQRAVARAMGTTQSAVSDLETGVTKDPCMATLAKWAYALDLELAVEVRPLPEGATCGARGFAGGPGCIRRAGHDGGHGYSDGSGEQDALVTRTGD